MNRIKLAPGNYRVTVDGKDQNLQVTPNGATSTGEGGLPLQYVWWEITGGWILKPIRPACRTFGFEQDSTALVFNASDGSVKAGTWGPI